MFGPFSHEHDKAITDLSKKYREPDFIISMLIQFW